MATVVTVTGSEVNVRADFENRLIILEIPQAETSLGDEAQIALAIQRHFPRDEWGNALNVARLESGYNRLAHNQNGEDSRGVFQINVVDAANPQYRDWDLWDIEQNVLAASQIHASWGNWGAWYNAAVALGLPH